jgi:hypothetical protein
MITLLEAAMLTLAGIGVAVLPEANPAWFGAGTDVRGILRGAGCCPAAALASETRKGESAS